MLKHIVSFILFIFFLIGTVVGLSWYNGYDELKKQGSTITYWEHVQDRVRAIRGGSVTLPGPLNQLTRVEDELTAQNMELFAQAIDEYQQNTGDYPLLIGDIVGGSITDFKNLYTDSTFTYRRTRSGVQRGFEMSVKLPSSGERYMVSR